jgi:hypothetical protein
MMERVFKAILDLRQALSATTGTDQEILIELEHEAGRVLLSAVHAYNRDVAANYNNTIEITSYPEALFPEFRWEEVQIDVVRVRWPAQPDDEPDPEIIDTGAWGKSEEVSFDDAFVAGLIPFSEVPGDGE